MKKHFILTVHQELAEICLWLLCLTWVRIKMLLDTLDSLKLSGYKIEISEVEKSGIAACDFNVLLDKEHENHDHDMEYLHGDNHEHSHAECHHEHEHQHSAHTLHHEHRSLPDILTILENSSMTAGAKSHGF